MQHPLMTALKHFNKTKISITFSDKFFQKSNFFFVPSNTNLLPIILNYESQFWMFFCLVLGHWFLARKLLAATRISTRDRSVMVFTVLTSAVILFLIKLFTKISIILRTSVYRNGPIGTLFEINGPIGTLFWNLRRNGSRTDATELKNEVLAGINSSRQTSNCECGW